MKRTFFRLIDAIQLIILIFFLSSQLYSQELLINGKVFDKATNQTISTVSVYDRLTGKGAITDTSGIFKLRLPAGIRKIGFSYIGYDILDTVINLRGNLELSVFLTPAPVKVGEVTIISEAFKNNVSSPLMGSFTITNKEMMRLPSLLGESDPFKLIQLTPGVKSASYGGASFYVRGGGSDQNLILFDNTILYNPGHLLGIFSVFNPGIIKDISIIKSGIPAQYGGKLSSVIQVNSYKGKRDSLEVVGSTGLISSRIVVGGPLFKQRGTFIIGTRRTYLGLTVKPIVKLMANNTSFLNKGNNYNFYDLNIGVSLRLTDKDVIGFSAYQGRDNFKMGIEGIKQENYLNWGNNMASFNWDHKFHDMSQLNTKLSWTKYEFDLSGSQSEYLLSLFSSVEDLNLKSEYYLKKERNKVILGYELIDHRFIPRDITARAGNFQLNLGQFGGMHAIEAGLFLNDEFSISPRLSAAAGLRFSFFNHIGPYNQFIRNKLGQVYDTIYYLPGKSLAVYLNPEPRFVLKYKLSDYSAIKLSYMRVAQYIHLATSASASLPTDIWIPSTSKIKPLIGDQVSLGYFTNFSGYGIEFSSELYYKSMQNQIEFLRGLVNISIKGSIEDNIAVGFGQSYGVEFYLAKKQGNTTGWLSYTLSRTEQKFDEINQGLFYPAKYDGRHDLSLNLTRKLNEKWSGAIVFSYITGNAFTMPIGRYIIQGNVVNQYGRVNSFRLPANHRMDVSMTRKLNSRKNHDSELIFSIYNVYNRANPYFIYYEVVGNIEVYSLEVKPFEVTLIPIIPSISWNFKF